MSSGTQHSTVCAACHCFYWSVGKVSSSLVSAAAKTDLNSEFISMYVHWVEIQKLLQRGQVEETWIGVQLNHRGRAVLGAATNPAKQKSHLFFFSIFPYSFPCSPALLSHASLNKVTWVLLWEDAPVKGGSASWVWRYPDWWKRKQSRCLGWLSTLKISIWNTQQQD